MKNEQIELRLMMIGPRPLWALQKKCSFLFITWWKNLYASRSLKKIMRYQENYLSSRHQLTH